MRPISPIQREKTVVALLTVLPTPPRLKGAVIEFTAPNSKFTNGGNVDPRRPPQSGFCISTVPLANNTRLLGVARTKKPTQRGNNRGVSIRALTDSQQLNHCQTSKYTNEVNAL